MSYLKHALIFSALAICSVTAFADIPPTLAIGATAPDFCLKGVDEKEHCLADYAEAKVLVLVFTCNHCPTAQAYEDRIQKLHDDYKDKGVALVAISPNDPLAVRLDELGYTDISDGFEDMQIRAEYKMFTFPYLYDGDTQEISRQYGPVSTPHTFVFDAERKLRYQGRIDSSEKGGEIKSHEVRDAIEALLADQPVKVETTKPYGCSTKWSDKRPTVTASLEKWEKEPVKVDDIDAEGIKKLLKNDSDNLRLINTWASWCGPCVAEFPELVEIRNMYRTRDFEMVTLSAEGPKMRRKVEKFLENQHASMTNYLFNEDDIDAFSAAFDKKWTGAIPYTLLIAPGGEVLYRYTGMIEPLELKRAIVDYLGRTF